MASFLKGSDEARPYKSHRTVMLFLTKLYPMVVIKAAFFTPVFKDTHVLLVQWTCHVCAGCYHSAWYVSWIAV